jgi:hypothetical protein
MIPVIDPGDRKPVPAPSPKVGWRRLVPAFAALYGVAYVYSAALKGSAADNAVLWSVRHPMVAAELFLDPPPHLHDPRNVGLIQAGA